MAYDEGLAERIRTALRGRDDVVEKKMFGGLTFMVAGRMACGVVHDDLMVRVGPGEHGEAIAQPHARPMDFTGKPMQGMVYVAPAGVASDDDLRSWVDRAVSVATTERLSVGGATGRSRS
jgi:TfoX/Sxy family transcriptional regulator of competence genes